jgi:hypothetical protein
MWLCLEETGMTRSAIAERFGGVHYSAMAQFIRRTKKGGRGREFW